MGIWFGRFEPTEPNPTKPKFSFVVTNESQVQSRVHRRTNLLLSQRQFLENIFFEKKRGKKPSPSSSKSIFNRKNRAPALQNRYPIDWISILKSWGSVFSPVFLNSDWTSIFSELGLGFSPRFFPNLKKSISNQVTWGLTSAWRQLTSALTWQLRGCWGWNKVRVIKVMTRIMDWWFFGGLIVSVSHAVLVDGSMEQHTSKQSIKGS